MMDHLPPVAATVAERLVVQAGRVDDAWQIPADEARLLHVLALAAGATRILEIGVSYGFSTLHWGDAARRLGGRVDAVEADERKVRLAGAALDETGLADHVTLHLGRAQDVVPDLASDRPFDLLFIDAVKEECFAYLETAWPRLADRCVIITDNTTTHPEPLAEFLEHLRAHPEIIASTPIPVGNGIEVSVRDRDRAAAAGAVAAAG